MHKFKYVRMCSVTLVSGWVGLRFFSLMPKWFCKVKQLMACDISGWATVELGISGFRWQRCSHFCLFFPGHFFLGGGGDPLHRAGTIALSEATSDWLYGKQNCTFTTITHPSPSTPSHYSVLCSEGQCRVDGWIHYRSVRVPNPISKAITLEDGSCNVKQTLQSARVSRAKSKATCSVMAIISGGWISYLWHFIICKSRKLWISATMRWKKKKDHWMVSSERKWWR